VGITYKKDLKKSSETKMLPLSAKSNRFLKRFTMDKESVFVLEGSVRSGKTVGSLIAFIYHIIHSGGTQFLITAKTQGVLEKNLILKEHGILYLAYKIFGVEFSYITNAKIPHLKFGDRIVYCVGADNKKSADRLTGLDSDGWYADEINLCPKNFIREAMNRVIASKNIKIIWTLNPDSPTHYIYKDYIDKFELEKPFSGYSYWHFTLEDNPAVTEERRKELETTYKGYDYDRFILGKRVRAEGAIYSIMPHHIVNEPPFMIHRSEIGVDFGGNKSATVFVLVGYDKTYTRACILDEFYDDRNLSVDVVTENLRKFFYRNSMYMFNNFNVYCDSAETLIIRQLRSSIKGHNIVNAKKTKVDERIKLEKMLFNTDRMYILSKCEHTINAFKNAVLGPDGKRLDDGSYEVDCLDATEYCLERHAVEGELIKRIL
jgi:PBSX family phage terminase large subunit